MGRIPGAEGFGEAVARPQRFNETQVPRGAFGEGIGQVLTALGGDMQRRELEQAAQAEREREAADRALAVQRVELGRVSLSEAVEQLGEEIRLGKVSKDDAEREWERRAETVARGAQEEAPGNFGPLIKGGLDLETRKLFAKVRGFVSQRNRDDTRGALMTVLEAAERQAIGDRPSAIAKVHQALETLGPVAGLGADDQVRMFSKFRESAAYTAGHALVRAAGTDSSAVETAAQRIAGEEFADLSPQGREQLETQITNRRAEIARQAEAARQRAEAAAERRLRRAEHEANALQGIIDGGALPDDAFLASVQRATSGTPYAQTVKALVAQGQERAAFGALSPDEQREQLLRMRATANAQGSNPAQEKRIRTAEEIHARQARLVEADPLRWAVGTRLIDQVEPMQFADLTQLAGQLGRRVDQAETVGARLRRGVSPLLAAEAQRAGEMLELLPTAQRAGAVRQIAAALPPDQQRAFAAQLKDRSAALGYAMFAASSPNPPGVDLPALILRGEEAIKAGRIKKAGEDGVAVQDRLRIARELDAVAWATPKARDAAVEATNLVYDGLRDQRGGSASWSEAVRIATGGLARWNERKVPLPPGWDERRFKAAMGNVDAVTLGQQMRGPVFVNGIELRLEQLAPAWSAVTLVPVGPGRYALETGGALVMTDQQRPFVYTLRD